VSFVACFGDEELDVLERLQDLSRKWPEERLVRVAELQWANSGS
jgi:hypothetical protein